MSHRDGDILWDGDTLVFCFDDHYYWEDATEQSGYYQSMHQWPTFQDNETVGNLFELLGKLEKANET